MTLINEAMRLLRKLELHALAHTQRLVLLRDKATRRIARRVARMER